MSNGTDDPTEEEEKLRELLDDIPSDVKVINKPSKTNSLRFCSLRTQTIHGNVQIGHQTHGIVASGLQSYLEERLVESLNIPSTYRDWDDEFANAVSGGVEPIYEGPCGAARNDDRACQFSFGSDAVRADAENVEWPNDHRDVCQLVLDRVEERVEMLWERR